MAQKSSKVIFKDKNLDLYRDNYVSFKTTYPISSGEGFAVFLTNVDMFDSLSYKNVFSGYTSGYGLGLLPSINPYAGAKLWTFNEPLCSNTDPTLSGSADVVGLSAGPNTLRDSIFDVSWGDSSVEYPRSYSGLNHHYLSEGLAGVSARFAFFNHIASVAIDGAGGYGKSDFAFTSGGNSYLTPYSITNRVLTDPLSSNQRAPDEYYSVATHFNTTASLPVLSTGYKSLINKDLSSAYIYSSNALTFRVKFSAFLLGMRVDLLSGGEYITLANLSGININDKDNKTFLGTFPRYARLGIAYSGDDLASDLAKDSSGTPQPNLTDVIGLCAGQGVQNLTFNLG